eukprot:MONOS_11588.1-p1 / transcript=MONOS_11588.1 / gene=MONOS_11588 / organism=Monocercomonoides_exilis_PA203 / gene_product=unspecified product / transcript_product=unspecified product / location=Mono_scaffold00589:17976-19253(+) / protein_length=364 / sequence_SO=supercontig / SO=protein_coding / is_pseudo=false
MRLQDDDKFEKGVQTMTKSEQFSKLFCDLECCREDEQMQEIEGMNRLIEEMNKEEFKSVFTEELFNKINKMIEEEKIILGNTILLLKHVGYCKAMKRFYDFAFNDSFLSDRFQEMIVDENERKKEEKNEKLLINLCECFTLLNDDDISDELRSIAVPRLLKAASDKDESEKTRKEVEIALLALSNINKYIKVKQELYLKEITEIIKHQQKHRNLTHLAFQSAWQFLINKFFKDRNLEDTIANELHFAREAARELDELSKCVDWKRKKDEERRGKEMKKVHIIRRWLDVINTYFTWCTLWNEEWEWLIRSLVLVFREAKDNYRDIGHQCILCIRRTAENRAEIKDLLESGAIDLILEEIQQAIN